MLQDGFRIRSIHKIDEITSIKFQYGFSIHRTVDCFCSATPKMLTEISPPTMILCQKQTYPKKLWWSRVSITLLIFLTIRSRCLMFRPFLARFGTDLLN